MYLNLSYHSLLREIYTEYSVNAGLFSNLLSALAKTEWDVQAELAWVSVGSSAASIDGVGCFALVQAYRWDDNVAVVEWLSQQLAEDRWQQSFLCENIRCVQRDHIMQRMRS